MAFNAGSIEATLTLDRSPFNAGLKAARAEAKKGIEVPVKAKLDNASLQAVKDRINAAVGSISVKVKLDNASLQVVKDKINAAVGTINAKVKLDNASLQAVKEKINTAVGTINAKVKLDNASLQAVKEKVNAAVGTINAKVKLDNASLTAVRDRINAAVGTINVKAKLDNATLTAIRERINAAVGTINVRAKLDNASLNEIKARINAAAGTIKVKLELDSASLAAVRARIAAIRGTIRVRIDVNDAQLLRLIALLAALRDVDINVNANTSGAVGGMNRMHTIIAAVTAALPVLGSAMVSVIALAGALGTAFGVAAIGIGALALVAAPMMKDLQAATADSAEAQKAHAAATERVTEAQLTLNRAIAAGVEVSRASARAIADAKENLTGVIEDAARSQIAADRDVEDAERALADTVTQAADDMSAAMDDVASAQQNVDSATRDLADAQQNLTDAIVSSREAYEDFTLSLRDGGLDVEQAQLNLEQNQADLDEAIQSGMDKNSLKFRQLELDVRQSALAVDSAKERMGDLNEASAEWAKTGTDGTREVIDAQRGVEDSTLNLQNAEKDLAKARTNATKVATEGQNSIAAAERNLNDARDKSDQTRLDNIKAIDKARRAVDDAEREAARDKLRAAQDIAEAQRELAKAQKDASESAVSGAKALTAAEQVAAAALRNLKNEYEALRKRTEVPVANMMAAMFDAATAALKTLDPIIRASAEGMTILFEKLERYFGSPHWKSFVDMLSINLVPIITKLGDILGYAVIGVMNLMTAFAPFTQGILDGGVQGMKDFAHWAENIGNNTTFKKFLDEAKDGIPALLHLLGSIIEFLFKISVGLAPLGTMIMNVLSTLFDWLNKLPPEWLGAIAFGIGAIWVAMAFGATGPVGIAIGILAGAAVILADLAKKPGPVKDAFDNLNKFVKEQVMPVWDNLVDLWKKNVIPAWERFTDVINDPQVQKALQDMKDIFVDHIWPILKDIAETLVKSVIPGFLDLATAIAPFLAPIFVIALGAVATTLGAIAIAFDVIGGFATVAADVITGRWDKLPQDFDDIKVKLDKTFDAIFGEGTKKKVQDWFLGLWGPEGSIKKFNDDFMADNKADWDRFWGEFTADNASDWDRYWKESMTQGEANRKPFVDAWTAFYDGLNKTIDDFNAAGQKTWDDFWTKTNAKGQENRDSFAKFWVDFYNGLNKTIDDFNAWGQKTWDDYWAKTNEKGATNRAAFAKVWNDFFDGLNTKVDEFNAWGQRTWDDYWKQTNEKGATNRAAFAKFWSDFFDGLNRKVDEFNVWGKRTWDEFWGYIGAKLNEWSGNIQRAVDGMWAAVTQRTDRFVTETGNSFRRIGNFFRDPINWVINVVINDGIIGAWNAVMRSIGATGGIINFRVPSLPAFREGGPVRGPGSGTSDSIMALVSNDEFIVNAKRARQHKHFLTALNAGQAEAIQAAGGGNSPSYPRFAGGGPVDAGLSFARAQQGKPYVWGGVGPNGFDCSGFMSAITNTILGRNPYSRIGTTSTVPWPGWTGGLSSQFTMGNLYGSHMAGTLGGANVESGSGHGPEVGGRALGSTSGMFTGHYSLPQVGGAFVDGGGGGGAAAPPPPVSWWSIIGSQVIALFKRLIPQNIPGLGGPVGAGVQQASVRLVEISLAAITTKLENMLTAAGSTITSDITNFVGGVLGLGKGASQGPVLDNGGVIPAFHPLNGTGKKERVLNPSNTQSFDRLVDILEKYANSRDVDSNGTGNGKTINVNLGPVYNPIGEPAIDTLVRRCRVAADMGMFGED